MVSVCASEAVRWCLAANSHLPRWTSRRKSGSGADTGRTLSRAPRARATTSASDPRGGSDQLLARPDQPRIDRHGALGRVTEVEALAEVDAEVAHDLELVHALDALRDHARVALA